MSASRKRRHQRSPGQRPEALLEADCARRRPLRLPQGAEARADFFAEEFRLLPGREVPAPVGLVEVDQVVVGPLRPALGRLVNLAWKDRDGSRDGDVDGP